MRLRNIPEADGIIEASEYVIKQPDEKKGSWHTIFEKNNPIHIEVGMGKGQFLMGMARLHPDINYIGIEKYSSVLLRAVQKMEEEPLSNLRFLLLDADDILDVFDKGEVDQIYLNFSDPWPKDRHAKRRLPSRQFLNKFRVILKKGGHLEFKTDNRGLFDFAVEEAPEANWEILKLTYDLHADAQMSQGNVMTEYEEKFSAKGNPICKYIITPKD